MSFQRLLILTLGPIVIVGGLYWTTAPRSSDAAVDSPSKIRSVAAQYLGHEQSAGELDSACQQLARVLKPQLSRSCRVLVRPPFVIAGDLSEQGLQRHYEETIVPTARALSTLYFDQAPDQPITILIFSGEAEYRKHAEALDGRQRPNYSGYYQRSHRRVMLDMATGSGTLAHELTHALAHFDFADMPEWFDEGLASLMEQSEFSADGLRLIGVSNWRLNYLIPNLKRGQLRSLESLISSENVRPNNEAVDYAHARYLCLYLQQRQLLEPYYRKFRNHIGRDSSGLQTLRELLGTDSLNDFDQDFRKWLISLVQNPR